MLAVAGRSPSATLIPPDHGRTTAETAHGAEPPFPSRGSQQLIPRPRPPDPRCAPRAAVGMAHGPAAAHGRRCPGHARVATSALRDDRLTVPGRAAARP